MNLLTAEQVAEKTGFSVQRVYALWRRKLMPCVRAGRIIRMSEDSLCEWIRNGGCGLSEDGEG